MQATIELATFDDPATPSVRVFSQLNNPKKVILQTAGNRMTFDAIELMTAIKTVVNTATAFRVLPFIKKTEIEFDSALHISRSGAARMVHRTNRTLKHWERSKGLVPIRFTSRLIGYERTAFQKIVQSIAHR